MHEKDLMNTITTKFQNLENNTLSLKFYKGNINISSRVKCNKATINYHPTEAPNNFSYLASIGGFIKVRTYKHSFKCQFNEKTDHRIKNIPNAGVAL